MKFSRLSTYVSASILGLLLSNSTPFVSAVGPSIEIAIEVPPDDALLRAIDPHLVSWSIQNRDLPIFSKTRLLKNFLNALSINTQTGQSIRLGGGESDKTTYGSDITITASKFRSGYYGAQAQGNVTLGPNYFASFKEEYGPDTTYIWCLNLINMTNQFEAAISTAAGVLEHLGDQIELFEIGNEADFYGSKGFRPPGWNAEMMLPEWNYIADEVEKINPDKTIRFAAGGFANPLYSVTQDFDIPGLIAAGYQSNRIPWYTMHLYSISGCSQIVSLEGLLQRNYFAGAVSSYASQIAAAESVGAQFAIGESNTVTCSGRPGVSDTLGAALWMVDYVLLAASIGIRRIYFHATSKSSYSPIIPVPYEYLGTDLENGNYSAGVLPLAYGAYFLSEVLSYHDTLLVTPIKGGNDSDYSSYSLWDETNNLRKIVVVNLELYNTTTGINNDAVPNSPAWPFDYPRPSTRVNISTPWTPGEELSIIRLQGPGSNAKGMINVSDFTFSAKDGSVEHNLVDTIITVQEGGYVLFDLFASEAALVQPYSIVTANPHPVISGSKSSNSTVNGVAKRTRGAESMGSNMMVNPTLLILLAILAIAIPMF